MTFLSKIAILGGMERKIITTNRKAFHNYEILERLEAGIELKGYEVKSLRQGKSSLGDSFVGFSDNQAYLENAYIPPYVNQSTHIQDYNPNRKRKLLLHQKQIINFFNKVMQKGLAVVPLEMYFSTKGVVKVEIALAKGKKLFDKRATIKKRDLDREMEREA